MEHYPSMSIHFPPARETDLHEEMKRRAAAPWSAKSCDAFGRMPKEGSFFFHHDFADSLPGSTLCIHRDKPGHWNVCAIVPDKGQINPIPLEQYKRILASFESEIAEPAAERVEGMTAIEISQYRLEDYFSPNAVRLLKLFCDSSNQCDLGTHPCDQERWMAFLLCAYDDKTDVHCDVFGYCLRTAGWWPEYGVDGLVHEYDFAMRLLKQSGRS